MEISSKNSSDQYLFQIQQRQGTPEKTDSLFAENRNGSAGHLSRDFPSVSRYNHDEDTRDDGDTGMIPLKREAGGRRGERNPASRWVIDLSDSDSKMALRRHLGEMAECENSNSQSTEYSDMEILQKLPSDTVVIRQEARANGESCSGETTETSNGESSSGCAAARAKRISRTIRNKSEAMEVRRNPMRVSKKNFTRDFSQSKQLLAKRDVCSSYESKHTKSSPIPYMNTRSVTRKMYTVGATYQAPTKRDETEWKEWPVHGMHERPVYHPQAGLAAEYLGRYFTSLDGLSYCEIIDQPEIEIVAVDPHVGDRPASSAGRQPREKPRAGNKRPLSAADPWAAFLSPDNRSFEACMHGSLHYVLGYCSQIMSPTYKQTIGERMMSLTGPAARTSFPGETRDKDNAASTSESVSKLAEGANLLEAYAVAIAHSVRNKGDASDRRAVSNLPSTAVYMETQNSPVEVDNPKRQPPQPPSGEIARVNLKQILQDASSSSLILLRNSASKASDQVVRAVRDAPDPAPRLENADTEMSSSMYKSRACPSERACGCKESSAWNNLYGLKRRALDTQEHSTRKTFLLEDQKPGGKKILQVAGKPHENRGIDEARTNADSSGRPSAASSDKSRAWTTNRTSEIARILSEYNKTISRKSTMHGQIYGSRGAKPGVANPSKSGLWQRDNATSLERTRSFVTDTGGDFSFSQGKWKRFYLTRDDRIKDPQASRNVWHGYPTSFENYPDSLRNHHASALNYVKEKPVELHNDSSKHEVAATDAKPKEAKSGYAVTDKASAAKTRSMQELLENTAILYCAANGVHQDDLSTYIDNLDAKQSTEWLEEWKNSVV